MSTPQRGQIQHDNFGSFRLPRAGLSADEDGLGFALFGHHLAVGSIGDGVDVRAEGFGGGVAEVLGAEESLLAVGFEDFPRIKRQPLKRIHRNQHRSRPRINLPPKIPIRHSMQNRRLVQMLQRNHIIIHTLGNIRVTKRSIRQLHPFVLGTLLGGRGGEQRAREGFAGIVSVNVVFELEGVGCAVDDFGEDPWVVAGILVAPDLGAGFHGEMLMLYRCSAIQLFSYSTGWTPQCNIFQIS
mmetsp:Transcript_31934/g.59023  ORF Transcript_31934/g.59023 Transcript_31934/m.59023 type:complete len:241 (-) Transcript_31934:178-900(-)